MIEHALVEPLGADLVTFAQCLALNATVFPRPCAMPAMPTTTRDAPSVWVARAIPGGPVVGFSVTERHPARLEITGLGVDLTHRGRGFGRALLTATVDTAVRLRCTTLSLHVSVANRAAIALYDAGGFHVTARLRGFYTHASFAANGDAYEMMKRL